MIPTRVGVNRLPFRGRENAVYDPHACGGEPVMYPSTWSRIE